MRAYDAPAVDVAGPTPTAERAVEARERLRRLDQRPVALALIAALSAIGLAFRAVLAQESIFGDELSTYWIVTTNDLGGVLSTVHSNAEISPPLSFVLGWLATQLDTSAEALRTPSLIAGTATIPALYYLGWRSAGRAVGLLAAAFAAFAPFMIYYSAEGRGYALMMASVTLSTLAMLLALDTERRRWWIVYGAFSCAAVYTHYTCVFVLGLQLLWLLWVHPEARVAALLANLGAAVVYIPWLSGLAQDFDSPTTAILSQLQPFDAYNVRQSLEHWSIGYPYRAGVTLSEVPGRPALIMLGLAAMVTLAGLVLGRARELRAALTMADRRVLLIFGLALATPVGAAVFSSVGSIALFSTRNLAASWPGLALASATLIVCAGPRLRTLAALLAVSALAIAAVNMLQDRYGRPQFDEAAAYVGREARSGDVVIDETGVNRPLSQTPGPLSHLDIGFDGEARVVRSLMPAERDHPFGIYDRVVPREEAAREALANSPRRVFLVTDEATAKAPFPLPSYREVASRRFPGLVDIVVREYRRFAGA